VSSDDGFGPVARGGGRGPSAPARPPKSPPARPAHPTPGDGGFGPVQRGRGSRGLLRRLPRLGVVSLLVVALAGVALGGALLLYTTVAMNRTDVAGLGSAAQMNVLIIGNDSREGLSEEDLQALGTEAVDGDRTDTIFLLSMSGGRAAMLSFPRDLFVTRCDGTQGRINAAYAIDGPSCMAQTVAEVSGIPVTHYLEVNFLGFIDIVDAVGGVSIFLDEPMVDVPAGVDLPAGCNELDGFAAIGFVRARGDGGDLGRIARQQRFLSELAEEITAPSTLVNVPRLFSVAGAGASAVTADRRLGPIDLLKLARGGRGLAGGGLATYVVPATAGSVGGASVLIPDDAQAAALFEQFRDGSILQPEDPEPEVAEEPDGEAPEAPAAPPEDVAAPDEPPAPDAAGTGEVPEDC
jgi:LCP family protein required for cell wall assembly